MASSDIGNAFLIITIFGLIQLAITLSIGLSQLKNNWTKYRCNPLVIPLAGMVDEDPIETFNECTKEIQAASMEGFLQPIYVALDQFLESGNLFVGILESLKTGLVVQHGSTLNIMEDIGVRFNMLLTELSKAFITVTDMFGKVSSMITVIFYLVTTSVKLGHALNNDLPGTVFHAVAGNEEGQ